MKYILFIIAAASSCSGIAQTSKKRPAWDREAPLTAGIRSGFSCPLGKYHSGLHNGLGLADKGAAMGVDATYFFSRHLGVNLSFTHQFHTTNAVKRAQLLGASNAHITNARVRSGSFRVWDILAGLECRFPIAHNWNISWIAGGGILWTTTPVVTENTQTGVPAATKMTAARATSFVAKSRLSIQYALAPALFISFFGEGAHSEPVFSFRADETVTDRRLSMSFLNTGIGLRYYIEMPDPRQ